MTLSRSAMVSVGCELLTGRTLNSNLSALGSILSERGVPLREARVVPDAPEAVAKAILDLIGPHTLVVTTGGLGPTPDDLTLEGVSSALGLELSQTFPAIRESRLKGAEPIHLPAGSVPVPNPAGVVPGVLLQAQGGALVCLPGVPREALSLLPHCLDALGVHGLKPAEHWVRTWGIREIDLYRMVAPVSGSLGVSVAYLPSPGRVDLAFSGPGSEGLRKEIPALLGSRVYALERDLSLPGALALALCSRRSLMAVAESCTGGAVAGALTSVAGASRWFSGGVIAYTDSAKTGLLGVPPGLIERHGAVSGQVAEAMAAGAGKAFSVPCALSVTGIAGPGGGTPGKPVGTVWTGILCDSTTRSLSWRFEGDRETIRLSAAACAMGMLLEALKGER